MSVAITIFTKPQLPSYKHLNPLLDASILLKIPTHISISIRWLMRYAVFPRVIIFPENRPYHYPTTH